jgi:ribosomal RNA-processing protein 8
VDIFIQALQKLLQTLKHKKEPFVVADMGCGEAKIAQALYGADASRQEGVEKKIMVKSFDLVAANRFITACNIAQTPLADKSVHQVIFCLSLMGTDCVSFLAEANRLLKVEYVAFIRIVDLQT